MNKTRTDQVIKNSWYGFINKLTTLFFSFIVRTLFIKTLGAEYLGVEGLFSNILSFLSLAELGVGNVLIYSLYRPIVEKNETRIEELLHFYKKMYSIIAGLVFLIGILLIPFLKYIVNSSFSDNDVCLFYMFYLANSVVSYLAVRYTTLIRAKQEQYIIEVIQIAVKIVVSVAQIITLLVYKNFIIYLAITIFATLIQNIFASQIAKKRYNIHNKKGAISKDEKKKIFANVKSTFLYKVGVVVINATDNILISVLVGTLFVGYYSNYLLVINQLDSFISIICTSLIASIGNLSAESNSMQSNLVFKRLVYGFHCFSGTLFVGFCLIFNDFIAVWLGTQNILSTGVVVAIAFNFYVRNIINPVWMYREAYGLFNEIKYLMLITAILNLVFSIIGGKLFGISGIIVATALARICTTVWYEPQLLYKKIFDSKVIEYYKLQFKYLIITVVTLFLSYSIIAIMIPSETNIYILIAKIIIVLIISGVCFVLPTRKSDEFVYWKNLLFGRLKKLVFR